ncbi:MAG TPA: bifunctional diguanylate cyclase/phosphodiesterase [Solirubrobacteraceae bacterium]|nr:bifunctional diguanylate cyclase/phosphodiesterase [Solirubrobacteraceae bacterium]
MCAVPVVALGIVLATQIRAQADQSALREGRAEAALLAQTSVDPVLDGESLANGISVTNQQAIVWFVVRALGEQHIPRLRIRNLSGKVVFSNDGSGIRSAPDDEVFQAVRGQTVARLTRLNTDANDRGAAGPETVEVYAPLTAVGGGARIGVLEVYLPYAPIAANANAGVNTLYIVLAVGLLGLYLMLFAITGIISRSLRRQLAVNAFLAGHDTLTQLPNRDQFRRLAEEAIAVRQRGRSAAIAIVDLDRFKHVNETLGHRTGDELLTELARRLTTVMRTGDTVARLGGDEFGLIIRDVEDAEPVLRRLREAIDCEVEVSGLPLSIEASVGYALAPEDGTDIELLLRRADLAMYGAKAGHTGVMRYEESLDSFDAQSLSLLTELRGAIEAGQLVLHYQPQSGLEDERVVAIEALVRWQHPEHGLLGPGRFLPMAEQTDNIDRLTVWVLRRALRDVQELVRDGSDISVAVNVSARSLARPSFADEVVEILDETGTEPGRLIIEVTETALLVDPERAGQVLDRLSQAGVGISLDDFGRGQTSLAYLSALPLDELKIDSSFVADMTEVPAHRAIVRSMIDLGHRLDLRVVAEGIETDDVLSSLRSCGCDLAQGYLLARPMPIAELQRFLEEDTPDGMRSAEPTV